MRVNLDRQGIVFPDVAFPTMAPTGGQWRALEGDYDVITVDARSHGRSDGPEGAYGLPTLAGELAARSPP